MGKKSSCRIEWFSHDAVTVFIDCQVPTHIRASIDMRELPAKMTPVLPPSPFQPEILRLIELGSDYVDIGGQSDWIAAEFPGQNRLTPETIEEVGEQLQAIRDKIVALTAGIDTPKR